VLSASIEASSRMASSWVASRRAVTGLVVCRLIKTSGRPKKLASARGVFGDANRSPRGERFGQPSERYFLCSGSVSQSCASAPQPDRFCSAFKGGRWCAGWGGRDRTSEWRNQNPFDFPIISRRVWKKWPKDAPAISIAWLPFPNEKGQLETTERAAAAVEFCFPTRDSCDRPTHCQQNERPGRLISDAEEPIPRAGNWKQGGGAADTEIR
jgi:hypothetical protein